MPYAAATNLAPSAEEATADNLSGKDPEFHAAPELVEMPIRLPPYMLALGATATITRPSAEEAAERQVVLGASATVQVTPESAEVYIGPSLTTATSFVPSADEATACQFVTGALASTQAVPELVDR